MAPSASDDSLIQYSQLPDARHHHVAYSGGADSTALLHALSQIPELTGRLTAHHINHQLQTESIEWVQHCQSQCEDLGVPLQISTLKLPAADENTARQARYQAIAAHMDLARDCLHTGHHLDDQIETVLFRLFRGAGLGGLTGIHRTTKTVAQVRCHRPLLSHSKQQLKEYLAQHELKWIEDPSNQVQDYDRNQIRYQIVPQLMAYQADVGRSIEQSRSHLQATQSLLRQLIPADNPQAPAQTDDPSTLATWLYHWLDAMGVSAPHQRRLNQFAQDCLAAAPDKMPKLVLPKINVCLWQQRFHAVLPTPAMPESDIQVTVTESEPRIQLPVGLGSIHWQTKAPTPLTIRFQQNGERILLPNQSRRKKVKKLNQQHQVPPWERAVMPFVYLGDELVAVGNRFIAARLQQQLDNNELQYRWHSDPQLL